MAIIWKKKTLREIYFLCTKYGLENIIFQLTHRSFSDKNNEVISYIGLLLSHNLIILFTIKPADF